MLLKTFVMLAVVALTASQRRYYSLEDMPETNFDCRDKILGGYYADPEANCQMFHVCVKIPGQGVQDFRFLCPNETSFDQENQICADSGDIDCEASGLYLENFDLYRIGSAQAKRPIPHIPSSKGTVVPLGPSTKSPILTNNIYEDDDLYLQKSETGDRRSHSQDILRGSSSSNFFNNRNKGKDLEDDEEEAAPRKPENNNQFRPRPSPPVRPKTQFQSQFRKAEPSTTTQQPQVENQNQLNDKKRTKIAVRKLTRKRPAEEGQEVRPSQQPAQQTFPAFTTQVTQKYAFGDQNSRYNTVNRQSTTPPTVGTSEAQKQPQQQPQQRFNNFRRTEQTTPAFFEPSPTVGTFSKAPEAKADGKDANSFGLLRNPIVAAGPSFQNRGSTNFQQSRPTTAAVNNFPTNRNFQGQNEPFPSQVPQQNFQGNQNFQQNRPTTPVPTGFPQQRQTNGNFQQNRQQPQVNNANFQNQQNRQNQQNFQQNQQQTRQPTTQGRQTTVVPRGQNVFNGQQQNFNGQQGFNSQQNFNGQQAFGQQQNRQTTPQQGSRQFYDRSSDEFDEGDNQEFLKTAPSNNFRPSDLNSFNNNYKSEEFDKNNSTRFSQTSTTKYYTPTIITTPKTTPAYENPTTVRAFSNFQQTSTSQPSNFYTPTVSTTSRVQQAASSTFQPPSSRLPQRIYPSPTPIKAGDAPKDAAYDYAYYDDAGSFSEYDSLDNLGESDFSRTSQRAKSRLI